MPRSTHRADPCCSPPCLANRSVHPGGREPSCCLAATVDLAWPPPGTCHQPAPAHGLHRTQPERQGQHTSRRTRAFSCPTSSSIASVREDTELTGRRLLGVVSFADLAWDERATLALRGADESMVLTAQPPPSWLGPGQYSASCRALHLTRAQEAPRRYPLPVIVIVGAGAAGLATAIFAARRGAKRPVVLFDGARRPGAKILVSGGARCNVTNATVSEADFQGSPPHLVRRVLRAFGVAETVAFFREIGVPLHEEENGKLFPDANRSAVVLQALLDEAARLGVVLRAGERVHSVQADGEGFRRADDPGDVPGDAGRARDGRALAAEDRQRRARPATWPRRWATRWCRRRRPSCRSCSPGPSTFPWPAWPTRVS